MDCDDVNHVSNDLLRARLRRAIRAHLGVRATRKRVQEYEQAVAVVLHLRGHLRAGRRPSCLVAGAKVDVERGEALRYAAMVNGLSYAVCVDPACHDGYHATLTSEAAEDGDNG